MIAQLPEGVDLTARLLAEKERIASAAAAAGNG
jgi:hypothetical protein